MIPNAVASTGAYAGLWGHLKSIDHALDRTLSFGDPRRLTELDRDRLQALIDLLEGSLLKETDPSHLAEDLLAHCRTVAPDYSVAVDFHQEIANHPAFKEWLKSSKCSVEYKVKRLICALTDVLTEETPKNLLGISPRDIPAQEFKVLRAILQPLLADTETALY